MSKKFFTAINLWNTTADPGSPGDGDLWYRSDLGSVRADVGGVVTQQPCGMIPEVATGNFWYDLPCTQGGVNSASGAMTVGTIYYQPLSVPKGVTLNTFVVNCTGAGTGSGNIKAAVFGDSSGIPSGTALFSDNTGIAASVTTKTWTPNLALTATSVYWIALAIQTATTSAATLQQVAATAYNRLIHYPQATATPVASDFTRMKYSPCIQTGFISGSWAAPGTLALITAYPRILVKFS